MAKKPKKRLAKKLLTGLEVEHVTIDSSGKVSNKADDLIRLCKKKNINLVKECSRSLVEMGAYPSVTVGNTCLDYLNTLSVAVETGEENGIYMYPFALPPISHKPITRNKDWYEVQQRIFGKQKFQLAGKTAGFHFHYTLPKGIFDKKKKFPKKLYRSRALQNMLNSYNLAIAMDPALVTLFQSSPYLDGKYVAKATRVLIQRTGRAFPFKGIYSEVPKLGGLPIYKHTLTDMISVINKRHEGIKNLFVKKGLKETDVSKYGRILQFSWHSVRVNKLGTMEIRSMDANHPKYIVAGTVMLKFINRAVNLYNYEVVPSDIGIDEPFKVEGDKIYIPPHTHVRKNLQILSAYDGFDSKEVYKFTGRFLRVARKFTDKEYYPAISPFFKMHRDKRTVSDELIQVFKKRGYDLKNKIPDDVSAEVIRDNLLIPSEINRLKKKVEVLPL